MEEEGELRNGADGLGYLLVRIHVPELSVQKCLQFPRDQLVWDVKQQCLAALPKPLSFSCLEEINVGNGLGDNVPFAHTSTLLPVTSCEVIPATTMEEEGELRNGADGLGYLLVRIHVPELSVQKCLQFPRDQLVWDVKQQCLAALPKIVVRGLCWYNCH
ncbi:hypothetical protein HUJ04_005383 [Dendroctonus ponderosae]|nr:hypothetical protein HUJ04_005383 [Dendroctonus ponderosae]